MAAAVVTELLWVWHSTSRALQPRRETHFLFDRLESAKAVCKFSWGSSSERSRIGEWDLRGSHWIKPTLELDFSRSLSPRFS